MSQLPAQILVVDDDPDLGTMLKMMLELRGYTVRLCEIASCLDQFLSEQEPHLIIMDMLLSGMNGVNICAQLKAAAATSHLQILMMSAHPSAREECLGAGADAFLAKPFDMEDLLGKTGQLVQVAKAQRV